MAYTETLTLTHTFTHIECDNCGVHFMMTDAFLQNRYKDKKIFYCPNGCQRWYGTSEADKLRKELDEQKCQTQYQIEMKENAERQRKAAEHRERAQKAAKTRIKNRIAKGVCPCCNRTFAKETSMAKHIATKHPDFVEK